MSDWPFETAPDAKALTTVGVIEQNKPILSVAHYDDENIWGFYCGTTDATEDGRIITMQEIFALDPSIRDVANLSPGARAYRASKESAWVVEQTENP